MMFCENCGEKIVEHEKFCGSCGNPVNGDANLVISRPGTVMGFAVKLHVTINDQEYDLGAGSTIKLKLNNGEYTIKYKIWCRREHEVVIHVEDNKVCEVIFDYDALWGGFKVSKKSVL